MTRKKLNMRRWYALTKPWKNPITRALMGKITGITPMEEYKAKEKNGKHKNNGNGKRG
jgi:hypothetical protein